MKALNKRDDVDFVIPWRGHIRFRLDEGIHVGAGYYGKLKVPYVALLGESRYSWEQDGCFLEGMQGREFLFPGGEY